MSMNREVVREAWAVVVAAGRGERFGRGYNKVFHEIDGRSILSRSIDALAVSGMFAGIVLVLSENDLTRYRELAVREGASPLVRAIVTGGATRRESVWNGLSAVPASAEIVAIHDAARPYVAPAIVRACVESARLHGSGVPAIPVVDTIKQIDAEGRAIVTLDRNALRAVQTPQAFNFTNLLEAYRSIPDAATDDAALYEQKYGCVHLVTLPECRDNIKITTERDLPGAMLNFRVGTGYDAHRLVEGRKLILCGVDVPFERGLLGHSDADVAVHALMDALLGAMALGDIGRHFPDTDPAYAGASSINLLGHIKRLMDEHGYVVTNADVTIVAQRPKLSPYLSEMVQNIAHALCVCETQINVKATTTEGMGFEGEGLGISAQAAALIRTSQLA